jgi:phenylalanyl-tRNA synthetase beta chain
MNISYEWLRSLVPVTLTPNELRDLITAYTAPVDEVVQLRADLANIVVGRVVEAARHPNSDHLWVTKVDAGGTEVLDVVCGAPNVTQGKLYPFAHAGTTLPGGLKLEKRKIRGAISNGMLCSARELGLGDDHQGILELQVDVAPGTPFLDAVPVGDTRIVIDTPPNRPDLVSHRGIAREVAAVTRTPLVAGDVRGGSAPAAPRHVELEGKTGGVTVRLDHPEGAPRYMGAVIRGVKVGPSPSWLAQRLEAVGSRSINNIVDVTNYVMHELGQPMHAFDLAKLGGPAVVIRRARAGERVTTLDGIERALRHEMTVIADSVKPHAIAGVMGGRESEVGEQTTDIFLEVALFEPRQTRATRMALGLPTDASYRFERGVDPELQPEALAHAVALITDLAGGALADAPIDVRPFTQVRAPITLRIDRVRHLLGVALPADECRRLLEGLGFRVAPASTTELAVTAPSWRRDIDREVDLIEEIARLHGYDSFPDEIRPYRPGTTADAPLVAITNRIRERLVVAGLYEARPMPFVRGAESGYVRVANPLAEDEAYLRRSILESLARRAEHNLSRMVGNVRVFEIGSVFEPPAGDGALPDEYVHAALLVMGTRRPAHFTEPRPPAYDEWDAKGLAERMAPAAFAGSEIDLVPANGDRLWDILAGGATVGHVRRVPLDAPVWASPAFGVELRLGGAPFDPAVAAGPAAGRTEPSPPAVYVDLQGTARAHPRAYGNLGLLDVPAFRTIPATPAVELDIALLVPEGTTAADVEQVIRKSGGELLERIELFDEFRGAGLPAGHRSVAWRLTFRHPERTLRDKEVEGRRDKLLRTLENELRVRARTV